MAETDPSYEGVHAQTSTSNSNPDNDNKGRGDLGPNLGPRKQLPSRRFSESRALEWRPPLNTNAPLSDIHITISYDDDGITPREIFYDGGYKSGSDLEALASEICIVLSIFLQHRDVDISQFAKSLTQDLDLRLGRQTWASLVGLFIAELQEPPTWERQLQELRATVEPQLDFDGTVNIFTGLKAGDFRLGTLPHR